VNRFLLATAALALLSSSAPLQARASGWSADQRYCYALSQLYMRYVGNPETEPRKIRRHDAAAEDAVAQWRRGNAVAAIPVLERKLTDNKFVVPQRE
jgi:hypothetical protein